MSPTKYLFKISFLSLLLLLSSCVKDIDMDQAQEIIIPPTAAIDLIYFELAREDLSIGPGGKLHAVDETRLEFLDDDYIQTSLMRADFNFRFTNSFENSFTANFLFRSESNAIRHQIQVDIPAGTSGTPAVVDYTEIINNTQIDRIRKSIKVSVEINMQEEANGAQGDLQLESKGTYYFEFK